MKLTKEQYDKLVHFIGYGNFPKANLVFWGNEEGTGQFPIEANILARCNDFGKDENGSYVYALKPGDWQSGYYEISQNVADSKIVKYLDQKQPQKSKNSQFLNMIARFSLALENNDSDINQWFHHYKDNTSARSSIKNFEENEILKPRTGVQTALIDWRPLPKKDEQTWYEEEYQLIDKNKYHKAFDLKNKKALQDAFTNYSEDVNKRKEIIKNAVFTYDFPIIIGFGNIHTKQALLQEIFTDIHFEEIQLKSLNVQLGVKGHISTASGNKTFLLLPFPDPRSRAFTTHKSEINFMDYYKEIFSEHILPLFKG